MKNTIRKLTTVLLAIIMVFAMSISAFAVDSESGSTASGNATLGKDKNMLEGKTSDENDVSKSGVRQKGNYVTNPSADRDKYGTYEAVENSVRIFKQIIIYNTRDSATVVYLPNVKFNYTITPVTMPTGSSAKHIKDEYGLSATVKSGDDDALRTGTASVTYSNTAGISNNVASSIQDTAVVKDNSSKFYVSTTKNGVAADAYFDITFDPTKFDKGAGIYRYIISEEEDTTLTRAKAGVTNTSYSADRYLDVYVQNNAAGTALEIYGYVLYEGTDITEFDASVASNLPLGAKTNGYVSDTFDTKKQSFGVNGANEDDVDLYLTSNLKVQKLIGGTMGDKTNEFPFTITVANGTIVSNPIISYQKLAKDDVPNTSDVNISATMTNGSTGTTIGASPTSGSQIKMKDQEFVYIYGIPGKNVASTVIAEEHNNTSDEYTVSAKYTTAADSNTEADIDVASGGTNGTSVQMAANTTANTKDAQTIHITKVEDTLKIDNSLRSISPTNVVMRYAPYLFILGAGMMLLLVSRRRKSEEE